MLGVHPVQRDRRRHEHRDRQDQADQLGQGQQRHLEEDDQALAVVDDQTERTEALAQEGHHGQGSQRQQGRDQKLAEQITLEKDHVADGLPLQPPTGRAIFYTLGDRADNQHSFAPGPGSVEEP